MPTRAALRSLAPLPCSPDPTTLPPLQSWCASRTTTAPIRPPIAANAIPASLAGTAGNASGACVDCIAITAGTSHYPRQSTPRPRQPNTRPSLTLPDSSSPPLFSHLSLLAAHTFPLSPSPPASPPNHLPLALRKCTLSEYASQPLLRMPATPLAISLPPLLLSLCLLTPFVRRLAARLSRFVPRLPSLAAMRPSPMPSLALSVLSRSNHRPPPRPASGRPSGGIQPRLKSQPAASAMPPNPAKMHPAAPQEFLGRNSYCARGSNVPPSRPPPPIALPHPRRLPSRSHSSALSPLPFLPRPAAPQEFFGKNSYARKAPHFHPRHPPTI